jgi:hypothetical protein
LEGLKAYNSSEEAHNHLKRLNESMKGCARPEGAGTPSISIEVLDSQNNEITIYSSITEAAQAIGVTISSISLTFKRKGESAI